MSGGWDASVLSLYLSSSRWKKYQNLTFSKLAICSTTVITQIINVNALISYCNQIKLTQSKSTWSQKCLLRCQFWLGLNVHRGMSKTAVLVRQKQSTIHATHTSWWFCQYPVSRFHTRIHEINKSLLLHVVQSNSPRSTRLFSFEGRVEPEIKSQRSMQALVWRQVVRQQCCGVLFYERNSSYSFFFLSIISWIIPVTSGQQHLLGGCKEDGR